MFERYRVLITGTGGGGTENLIASLRASKLRLRIVGTNMNHFLLKQSKADRSYWMLAASHDGYTDALNDIIKKEDIDLVIPNSDREVLRISEDRKLLNAATFLPKHSTIELCQDKWKLYQEMGNCGLPVPDTFPITSRVDVYSHINSDEERWIRPRTGSGSRAATKIRGPDMAAHWMDYFVDMRGMKYTDFMCSEYLPGSDYAIQSLWQDGNLILMKSAKRVEYIFGSMRASGQSSSPSVALTTSKSPMIPMWKIISAIAPDATGNFCIDVKCSYKDEIPYLTEINIGRFFMITNIFNMLGWNQAELYVRLAMGEDPKLPEESMQWDGFHYLIRELDTEPSIVEEHKYELWATGRLA
jgi:carbamoyl-phosphate synthase large subunit